MRQVGMYPHASVIIPTRNGMPLIQQCLHAVLAQITPWPFEVIVIDSGSSDGTFEFLEKLPVEHIRIQPKEFNHGKTRNFGASQAKGQFLVFLVQDAVPANQNWLSRLVQAAELKGAAGSYSKELPWPSDNPLVRFNMEKTLPRLDKQVRQGMKNGQIWETLSPGEKLALATFHDTSSCLRRQVWEKSPFDPVPYGEDLCLGERMIRAGYTIVYEPQSAVLHSHDRSGWYEMKRSYADHDLVMRLFDYHAFPRIPGMVKSWAYDSWQVLKDIYREPLSGLDRAILALRAPWVIGARHFGSYLGAKAAERRPNQPLWSFVDGLMRKGV